MATGQVIESTEYEADDGERRYRNLQLVTASPGGGRYVQTESYCYWPTPVGKEHNVTWTLLCDTNSERDTYKPI